MNILYYDESPWQSALWCDDLRKNKFILEAAQMLSTSIRLNTFLHDYPVYRIAYENHPCTKWTGLSRDNFKWTLAWMTALHKQRQRPHKSADLIPHFEHYAEHGDFPLEDRTAAANCARNKSLGLDFTTVTPTTKAYQQYSTQRWLHDSSTPTWYHGEEPPWRKDK